MTIEPDNIHLAISGLGIIFSSPSAVAHIPERADYLTSSFRRAKQVADHVNTGGLVAFETASPGEFQLRFHAGSPGADRISKYEFQLQLPLKVDQNQICFRDLYDLMDWTSRCPDSQTVHVDDGYYLVTIGTNLPESGVLGDHQEIDLYFQPVDHLPDLQFEGVPPLCF